MLTEDNMSADESGPLAGMPQAYINSARAADMRSPGENAYAPQHNGAIDRMPSGGDSPTDMDTGISSPPRYQEGRQGAIAPANSAEDQHEAASRPITPEIREDSWSCGTAQDDTHDRLRDITGVMNVASSFNSNQDGAVDPVLLSTGRRPASREPLHRDRTALAPLSNMKRASFPAIEGKNFSLCGYFILECCQRYLCLSKWTTSGCMSVFFRIYMLNVLVSFLWPDVCHF